MNNSNQYGNRNGQRTGQRKNAETGNGVNGWEVSEAGGMRLTKTAGEESVTSALRYETPAQIEVQAQADRKAADEAAEISFRAATKAEHQATRALINRLSESWTAPNVKELRQIERTGLTGAAPHKRFAQAGLLAHAVTERHPEAAYIAFETESESGTADNGMLFVTMKRKAAILNIRFERIAEIEQDAHGDDDFGTGDPKYAGRSGDPYSRDELGRQIANVYPVTFEANEINWERDEPEVGLADRVASLGVTKEARSFDDGTHPDVPNLFTVASAKRWVPDTLRAATPPAKPEPKKSLLGRLLGR